MKSISIAEEVSFGGFFESSGKEAAATVGEKSAGKLGGTGWGVIAGLNDASCGEESLQALSSRSNCSVKQGRWRETCAQTDWARRLLFLTTTSSPRVLFFASVGIQDYRLLSACCGASLVSSGEEKTIRLLSLSSFSKNGRHYIACSNPVGGCCYGKRPTAANCFPPYKPELPHVSKKVQQEEVFSNSISAIEFMRGVGCAKDMQKMSKRLLNPNSQMVQR